MKTFSQEENNMLKVKRTEPYNVLDIFKKQIYSTENFSLPYAIYIPKNYDCGENYPLLVFLHGAGERGDDNQLQLTVAIQKMFDDPTSPVYDSIVIAPQCPDERKWVMVPWECGNYSIAETPESEELEAVCGIIRNTIEDYNVDRDRIYITGISMGGYGTWDMLCRHGNRIAAGMPVCGGADTAFARKIKYIPIRTFHGSEDGAVPVDGTRKMFAALKNAGSKSIQYTELDGMNHGIWDMVYSDRENIDWLFSQRLSNRIKEEATAEVKKNVTAGVAGVAALSLIVGVIAGIVKKNKKKEK